MASHVLVDEASFHVDAARRLECQSGDPAAAALHYVRAVELILHAVHDRSRECWSAKPGDLALKDIAVLQQAIEPKLDDYLCRAKLLLGVADDERRATKHVSERAAEHSLRDVPQISINEMYKEDVAQTLPCPTTHAEAYDEAVAAYESLPNDLLPRPATTQPNIFSSNNPSGEDHSFNNLLQTFNTFNKT